MSCPNCDHTMQLLHIEQSSFLDSRVSTYWCQRCGTLSKVSKQRTESESPLLVHRARDIAELIVARDFELAAFAKKNGFLESCNTPERNEP